MALVVEIDGVRYPEGTRFTDASGDTWEFIRDSYEWVAPEVTSYGYRYQAYPSAAQEVADVYGPLTPEAPNGA